MTIRQADLARALGISEMLVSRILKSLYRADKQLTELDCLKVLMVAELQRFGLSRSSATSLIAQASSQVAYVAQNDKNRSWTVLVENGAQKFQTSAETPSHLDAILASHPLSRVMSLHDMVSRAADRLKALKAEKESA